jgi:hypothetical protein
MANNVVNPGLVNVADEGFGLGPINPNQPVTVSPSNSAGSANVAIAGGIAGGTKKTSTNPGTVNVADEAFGVGLPINVKVP